jgi:D-alanine-D-alanine ligase
MSEKSYLAVQKSLQKKYKHVGVTIINNEEDLEKILISKPDIAYLGMSSVPRKPTSTNSSPNIWLADFLEENDIRYTGSRAEAMMLDEDKSKAKEVIKKADISTANYFMAYSGQHINVSQLPLDFPMFIKPPKMGGGAGIDDKSVVNTFKEYKDKIKSLEIDHKSEALVEEYLEGREFTVAILKNYKKDNYNVMPLEMLAKAGKDGLKILGSDAKKADLEKVALIDDQQLVDQLSQLALNVFEIVNARDLGRVDIRMDADGVPHFLEINLLPSVIEGYGNFQKACELHLGLKYDDMLIKVVDLGLSHDLIEFVDEVEEEVENKPQSKLATA